MTSWQRGISPALRAVLAVAACLAVLLLPGCLTDGSIPVGGGSGVGVLRGVVVHAENPDAPLKDALVTARSREGHVFFTRSDAHGEWSFTNVPDGELEVTVEGPPAGDFLPVRVTVRTEFASFSTVAVALEPARMSTEPVTAVEVIPGEATTRVGEVLRFQAAIVGGNPLRKVPSWVVEGSIGSITARGEFQAQRAGTGTVRAIASGQSGVATVHVNRP